MRNRRRHLLMLVAWAVAGTALAEARRAPDGIIASAEPDWPQWRGPRRDGICDEKNLLPRWPAGGPKLLWKVGELGKGWSCPIICRDALYITGDVGRQCVVFAFGLDGKPKWRTPNGEAWMRSYRGARACCLYDDGRLYHMNAHGRVACLDPADGREIWSVDVLQRFAGRSIKWGLSECLLADGDRLIVTPGGRKAMLAALDKKTGRTAWATRPLGKETASYASPILFGYGGRRHIVTCSSGRACGVDADTGKIQWSRPRPTRYRAIATTPMYHDGHVLVASPDGKTAEMFRLIVEGGRTRAEQAWQSPMMDMSGCFTVVEGRIHGSGYHRTFPGWAAIDRKTGKVLYRMRDLERGAHLWADGLLYCVSQGGDAVLLASTVDGFETRGRFRLVQRKCRDLWAHPVIHDGRLYLRYHDTLWCFDVRSEAASR